ncbi:MAG TPA: hypothetical protein VE992_07405 [Solirubrobacteraceae bacterium]|nr:hypothetical protein [Solirubrobacteraceae bacterium]
MPRRHRHSVAVLAVLLGLIATPAALAGSSPAARSTAAAAVRAVHSPHLWATINICGPARHPHMLGVRAQMPSLNVPTRVSMLIQVDYWNGKRHAFVPDPGLRFLTRLGVLSYGTEQGGATWRLKGPTPNLRATVSFMWRRGGKLVARATRHTTFGHHDADHAVPPGYSSGFCTLR